MTEDQALVALADSLRAVPGVVVYRDDDWGDCLCARKNGRIVEAVAVVQEDLSFLFQCHIEGTSSNAGAIAVPLSADDVVTYMGAFT